MNMRLRQKYWFPNLIALTSLIGQLILPAIVLAPSAALAESTPPGTATLGSAPVVTIDTPVDNAILADGSSISGLATDVDGDINSVDLVFRRTSDQTVATTFNISLGPSGFPTFTHYHIPISVQISSDGTNPNYVPDGNYNLEGVATDEIGHNGIFTVYNVTVGYSAQIVTINTPTAGQFMVNQSVVSGQVFSLIYDFGPNFDLIFRRHSDGVELPHFIIPINLVAVLYPPGKDRSNSLPVGYAFNFSVTINSDSTSSFYVPEGQYDIIAETVDKTSQLAISTVTDITVDYSAPSTTLSSPLGNTFTNQNIALSGLSSDNYQVKDVRLYYQPVGTNDWLPIATVNNAHPGSSYSWDYAWHPDTEGNYNLKAAADDLAGNAEHSAYVYGVTYDVTSPLITNLKFLKDGSTVSDLIVGDNITVQASLSDAHAVVGWNCILVNHENGKTLGVVTLYPRGGNLFEGTFSIPDKYTDGTLVVDSEVSRWLFDAYDQAGNRATKWADFRLVIAKTDDTPPTNNPTPTTNSITVAPIGTTTTAVATTTTTTPSIPANQTAVDDSTKTTTLASPPTNTEDLSNLTGQGVAGATTDQGNSWWWLILLLILLAGYSYYRYTKSYRNEG